MDSAFFKGEFRKLLALTKKAEEYSSFDRLENSRVLMNKARAIMFLGNNVEGLRDFEDALQVFEEENSVPDIARVLLGLGGASYRQWGLEKGLANALRAILYFGELGDAHGLADACNRAGQSFGYRILYAEALSMYEEAVRIGRDIGHFNTVAEAYASMAWIYEAQGEYAKAFSVTQKAWIYAKKTESQWTYAMIYANFTVLYAILGDLQHAEEYYNQLIRMPKEVISNSFVRLAACKTALAFGKKEWKKGVNPSMEKVVRQSYAKALEIQGRLDEAREQSEKAAKLSRKMMRVFEHSNLHGFFLCQKQVVFGSTFMVRLDLINVSRESALVTHVDGLVPAGMKIVRLPDFCSMCGDGLVLHPRTLGPFQSKSVKLFLQAEKVGFFSFYPEISFADGKGHVKKFILSPFMLSVNAPSIEQSKETVIAPAPIHIAIEFQSEATHAAFDYLIHSFAEDSMRRRIPLEHAGWRTLMDVVKHTKITKHSLYQSTRGKGKPIAELERLGLVESKYFFGQRGRGGRITKVRVVYNNEAIKSQIEIP
jgi:tetratricopeptide (TPR) repeat protein